MKLTQEKLKQMIRESLQEIQGDSDEEKFESIVRQLMGSWLPAETMISIIRKVDEEGGISPGPSDSTLPDPRIRQLKKRIGAFNKEE